MATDARQVTAPWVARHQLLLGIWAFLIAFSILALGPAATPAYASTSYDCVSYEGVNAHCYSIGAKEIAFSGLEAQWHDLALTIPSSAVADMGHISNEMWMIDTNDCDSQTGRCPWIELGLERGCSHAGPLGNTCSDNGGVDSYMQFYAEGGPNGYFAFHDWNDLSADGDNHDYEMWDGSNGGNDVYDFYVDGSQIHASTKQLESSMQEWNVGIELFPGQSGEVDGSGMSTGDQFHNYINDYRNSVGSWNYVILDSTTSHDLFDGTCGSTDNCVTNPCSDQGDNVCFYGERDADYEWSDYKPG